MTVAKKAAAKPVKAATAEVKARNGAVLFSGPIPDAELFIANNFPRIHTPEAGPDFTVKTSPAGRTVKLPAAYDEPVETDDGDE